MASSEPTGSRPSRPNLRLEIPSTPSSGSPISRMRSQVSSLFHGRSVIERRPSGASQPSPKPNGPRIGLSLFNNLRNGVPYHSRRPARTARSPTSTQSIIDPSGSPSDNIRPIPVAALGRRATASRAHTSRRQRSDASPGESSMAGGADPGEDTLLHLVTSQQRGRRRKTKRRVTERDGNHRSVWSRRKVRHRACTCLLLGIILAFVLSIYLALAVTNAAAGQEFHILLIMIVLILTVFFCHSVIRLCMILMRPGKDDDRPRVPPLLGSGGYAQPERPIPIRLAQDEEMAVETSVAVTEDADKPTVRPPPPAYGLWRTSVRMNPNLVHWQRINPTTESPQDINQPRTATHESEGPRPPSYISEDGVEYVLEAQPRSTVYDIPLPPHPSERGRLDDTRL